LARAGCGSRDQSRWRRVYQEIAPGINNASRRFRAKLLHEFGQRAALRGGNPYRPRGYSRAAENLLAVTLPLDQIVAENRLREIPGVGDAIADIIAKLHKTGTLAGLEAMRKDVPAGVA
jgi:DNA polymerase (family 10)